MARKRDAARSDKMKTPVPARGEAAAPGAPGRPPRRQWLRRAGLHLLSIVLLSLSFPPFDCWFLAYGALVPWLAALELAPRPRSAALWAWGGGAAYWLIGLYWLVWITPLGYFLTVVYLSLYWLASAWLLRRALDRGWPTWLALPAIWVALEYARAYVISGFPWFYLAHSQYARTPLIQIADLTGQYGLSFLVAMANGAAYDLLRLRGGRKPPAETSPAPAPEASAASPRRRGPAWCGAGACAVLFGATLAYGWWRLAQTTTAPGPVVGIVQQAFPIALNRRSASPREVLSHHLDAAAPLLGRPCDLVLIPESMLPTGFNGDFLALDGNGVGEEAMADLAERVYKPEALEEYTARSLIEKDFIPRLRAEANRVGELSRQLGCPILAGGVALSLNPAPLGSRDHWLKFNAALWFDAGADPNRPVWKSAPAYYSKVHLVPFSEYVPFKKSWLGLHKLLRSFVPEVMEQLEPGDGPLTYELVRPATRGPVPSETDGAARLRRWGLAAPICYEGVFDYECRKMVWRDGRKDVDILVNLSNDGWFVWQYASVIDANTGRGFHGSTEYAQHLSQYCFRAVENRVPVVRAVNTGISASIDSCGRIQAVAERDGRRIMVTDTMILDGQEGRDPQGVRHGPLVLVDSRVSVYSRVGDVFAWAVSAAAAGLAGLLVRPERRPAEGARP